MGRRRLGGGVDAGGRRSRGYFGYGIVKTSFFGAFSFFRKHDQYFFDFFRQGAGVAFLHLAHLVRLHGDRPLREPALDSFQYPARRLIRRPRPVDDDPSANADRTLEDLVANIPVFRNRNAETRAAYTRHGCRGAHLGEIAPLQLFKTEKCRSRRKVQTGAK